MSDTEQQPESQKTIIAFVAGLLIGGLLVWIFAGGTPTEAPKVTDSDPATETNTETDVDEDSAADDGIESEATITEMTDSTETSATMETDDGSIEVNHQPAGRTVAIEGAVFPNDEGWIGVRDYQNGQMSGLLGVARFSKEQGLIPEAITLLRATEPGSEYAVVFYTESGDREFSLASDVQIPDIMTTFMAE